MFGHHTNHVHFRNTNMSNSNHAMLTLEEMRAARQLQKHWQHCASRCRVQRNAMHCGAVPCERPKTRQHTSKQQAQCNMSNATPTNPRIATPCITLSAQHASKPCNMSNATPTNLRIATLTSECGQQIKTRQHTNKQCNMPHSKMQQLGSHFWI